MLVQSDGRRFVGVEPYRTFPISEPTGFLSICDAEGHELTCIEDLNSLPHNARQMLQDELAQREFVPEVLRIESVLADSDPSQWRIPDRPRSDDFSNGR